MVSDCMQHSVPEDVKRTWRRDVTDIEPGGTKRSSSSISFVYILFYYSKTFVGVNSVNRNVLYGAC